MQLTTRVSEPAAPADARLLVGGFFALQFVLGYEWLMSGLSKLLAGDFATNLGASLADMTADQTGPFKSFIDGVAIPNGQLFAYLVMAGELTVGTVFVATSLVALLGWGSMGLGARTALLATLATAAIVGAFMSLNFHLVMGSSAPWLVSPDPYDQGVDLDSLMVVLQLVLAAVGLGYIRMLRGQPAPAPAASRPSA